MDNYCERQWLNKEGSASTGSYVAYHGPSPWGKDETMTFFEVADCNEKVRLHITPLDTKQDYITKLQLLADGLNKFIEFLAEAEIGGEKEAEVQG